MENIVRNVFEELKNNKKIYEYKITANEEYLEIEFTYLDKISCYEIMSLLEENLKGKCYSYYQNIFFSKSENNVCKDIMVISKEILNNPILLKLND